MMTETEYLEHGGMYCPRCREDDIEGGMMEVDGQYASQRIKCNGCGLVYFEHFQLISFSLEE